MSKVKEKNQPDLTKLIVFGAVAVFVLTGGLYAAYLYSKKQSSNIVLPGGTTYLGPSSADESTSSDQPPTAPIRFTAPPDVTWKIQAGNIYPYSFSYPSTLPLVFFPSDPSDSVAIAWGNIPAQQNILLNIESVQERDPELVNRPRKEFVQNWYKHFSGLKGVAKVETFTNTSGLRGYKASYLNYADASPNVDVFFEIPTDSKLMIHLANGILDPTIFDRLIDSVKWTPEAPPTSSP